MNKALVWVLCVVPMVVTGCKDKDKKKSTASRGIDSRGGIPIIPRGKVTLATAKGEKYLLEVVAPVSLNQAVSFYSKSLPRERWSDLQVQEVQPGLWGLRARRGLFVLTGRIKKLPNGMVSIGFERQVREASMGWKPPVKPDVAVLAALISWEQRVFDAGGNDVEIRGRSTRSAKAIRQAVIAALTSAGWSVTGDQSKSTINAQRSVSDKKWRRLKYVVDSRPGGAQVRLVLALDELAGTRPTPMDDSPAAQATDAGAPENPSTVVPVPADLQLWPTQGVPVARRIADDMLGISFERPCQSPTVLLEETRRRLEKQGFKQFNYGTATLPRIGSGTRSVTVTKGRRLVVATVAKELGACLVSLTVKTMTKRLTMGELLRRQ